MRISLWMEAMGKSLLKMDVVIVCEARNATKRIQLSQDAVDAGSLRFARTR